MFNSMSSYKSFQEVELSCIHMHLRYIYNLSAYGCFA